jgi:hypothetical protein
MESIPGLWRCRHHALGQAGQGVHGPQLGLPPGPEPLQLLRRAQGPLRPGAHRSREYQGPIFILHQCFETMIGDYIGMPGRHGDHAMV